MSVGAGAARGRRLRIHPVAVSALVSGAVGYCVLVLAARALGPDTYAEFAVFWAALYIVVGFLFGIQQETTRAVRTGRDAVGHKGARVLLVAGIVGIALSIAVAATSPLWGPGLLGGEWHAGVALIAVAAILSSGQFALTGALGGEDNWGSFSHVVITEALARLGLFVAVALIAPTLLGLAIASVAAFAVWPILASLSPRVRGALVRRADGRLVISVARTTQAMLAAGISGILTSGFPAVLAAAIALLPGKTSPSELSVLILLVTLTRAPLMVPLIAFTSVLVARFVDRGSVPILPALARPLLLMTAASVALAALAALLGPSLLPMLFGDGFQATGALTGALTLAAGGLGAITITGAMTLAARQHSPYLVGWISAIVASVAILLLVPFPIAWSTVASLAGGPIVGAGIHVIALVGSERAASRSRPLAQADETNSEGQT